MVAISLVLVWFRFVIFLKMASLVTRAEGSKRRNASYTTVAARRNGQARDIGTQDVLGILNSTERVVGTGSVGVL